MVLKKVVLALLPAVLLVSGIRAISQAYVSEIEGSYLYVDANRGSDSNSGASGAPFKTIQAAVNRANINNQNWIGTRIIVNPGTYREFVNIGNYKSTTAPLTIQAAVAGSAVVAGSDELWGWTWEWSGVYSHPWTADLGTCAIPSGWPGTIPPVALRTELLFVNGNPLTEVMSTSDLKPGTFYVNDSWSKIYVYPPAGTNLSSATVEAATRSQTLRITGRSNVVVRGMAFRHAASCINTNSVNVGSSWNVLFDSVQANWNNWGGIGISYSNNVTVQNSVASYNGGVGLNATHNQYVLLNYDETDYNNWRGAQGALYDWGMGGTKLLYMRNTTVQGQFAYRNQAQGLWLDTDNKNVWVNSATLAENQLAALQVEANEGPIWINQSHMCSSGTGVNVINTQDLTLWANTLYNNSGTNTQQAELYVGGKSGGRSVTDWLTGQGYNLYTSNMALWNNVFDDASSGQNVFGTYLTGYDWSDFASTLQAGGNQWYDPYSTSMFKITNNKMVSLSGWQSATGTDWGSSWSKPSTSPAGACWVSTPSYTDFAVSLDQESYTMSAGAASGTIRVNSFGYGTVTLWITGLPSGVWSSISQTSMVSGQATFQFGASNTAANQTVPVTLWAVSGSRVHSVTVYLHVTPS